MKCYMCKAKARIFCLCINPHIVMCYNHIRNHTCGRNYHRLKSLAAHQDKLFLSLFKSTISAITNHIISYTAAHFTKNYRKYINKVTVALQSEQIAQYLKESNINNQEILLKSQQLLNYITDFKKKYQKMREQGQVNYIVEFFFI